MPGCHVRPSRQFTFHVGALPLRTAHSEVEQVARSALERRIELQRRSFQLAFCLQRRARERGQAVRLEAGVDRLGRRAADGDAGGELQLSGQRVERSLDVSIQLQAATDCRRDHREVREARLVVPTQRPYSALALRSAALDAPACRNGEVPSVECQALDLEAALGEGAPELQV